MAKLFLTDYPIPEAKTKEILNLIQAKESVSTLWMPHSGRTDFAIQLQAKIDLPQKEWQNFEFNVLDVSLETPYLEKRFEEIKDKIRQQVTSGKHVVLILDSFSLVKASFIKYVFSFRHELPPKAISFLTLAFESEFFSRKTQITDMSLIYHYLIKVPYFTKEEVFDWLGDSYDKEEIYDFCGGIFGLLINLKRAIGISGSVNKAIESDQIKNTLEHIWGRFSERERLILKAAANNEHLPPYAFEINYMKQHNLLTAEGKLIGTWPKMLVGKQQVIVLNYEQDKIIYNGIDILEIFTPAEKKVFLEILSKKSLTREQIGDILWSGNALDKYSDWAIDQTMSRIRRKLDQIGISSDHLRTVKNKGVSLEKILLN